METPEKNKKSILFNINNCRTTYHPMENIESVKDLNSVFEDVQHIISIASKSYFRGCISHDQWKELLRLVPPMIKGYHDGVTHEQLAEMFKELGFDIDAL